MKIALAQLDMGFEDKGFAMKTCADLMEKAAAKEADLIVFPEMTLTGFTMSPATYGELKENSMTITFFQDVAKKFQMAVVFGVIFLEDGTARNHSIVMDKNGHILADYAKIHPFSYGAEAKYYSGGDELAFCQVDGVPLTKVNAEDLIEEAADKAENPSFIKRITGI